MWDDNNNAAGKRPESITINLLKNGSAALDDEGNPITVTVTGEGNSWNWSFEDLPVWDGYTENVYSVDEKITVTGYDVTITQNEETGEYTITNTLETVDITGTKKWDEADGDVSLRPESIIINLLADGVSAEDGNGDPITATVTAADNWEWSFTDLPKYNAEGEEINYTVKEDPIEDDDGNLLYSPEYSIDEDGNIIITNTYPAVAHVVVTKVWNDSNNAEGIRPESIIVELYQNGEAYKVENGEGEQEPVTAELNDGNGWSYTFDNLPLCDSEGKDFVYTIGEVEVPEGYTSVTADPVVDSDSGYTTITITNTHATNLAFSGVKYWDDADNQDGKRPGSITIYLKADGEYVTDEDGNRIEATIYYQGASTAISPVAEPIFKLLSADLTSWNWAFVDANGNPIELPKYDEDGNEIQYTVEEVDIDGYTSVITGDAESGFEITNIHTPETIDINGEKLWDDDDNRDGIRPAYVTLFLYAGNEQVIDDYGEPVTVTVTPDEEGDWSWSFTGLPKYSDGEEIHYSVKEDYEATGYAAEYTLDEDGNFIITNTHIPDEVSVSVTKEWDDEENQDGVRPDVITVELLADGEVVDTAEITEKENWSWTFENLPKNKTVITDEGNSVTSNIQYTVREESVGDDDYSQTGYEFNRDDDGNYTFTITNSYTPGKTNVSVTKVWEDDDNRDGVRPESVTVVLTIDGEETDQMLVLDETNDWTGLFTDLDEYVEGEKINYGVAEVIDGEEDSAYVSEISGDAAYGYVITNSYEPETISLSGTKVWDDNDNYDGKRHEVITVRLWADDEEIDYKEITANEDWSWSFDNLPKYRDGGKEIVYTFTEDALDDYTTDISPDESGEYDYIITNTHAQDKTDLNVIKSWDDDDDQDGIRPTEITVTLYANGEPALDENGNEITLTLTAADGWTGAFTDLDVYENGERIIYTVEEESIGGYTSVREGNMTSGYIFTNTHEPEKVRLDGEKVWDDANDQDGKRPDYITIYLMANNEQVVDAYGVPVSATVSEATGWTWSFKDLDKYEDGEEIEYSVEEEMTGLDGYTASYGDLVDNGDGTYSITVTDSYTPETIDITGTKTWDDNDDNDHERPESITVYLLADGVPVSDGNGGVLSATVTGDEWTYTFTDLPKYADGKEITYTVLEGMVEDYTPTYDGYDIINTHTPDEIAVTVNKYWEDEDNWDGIRPDSVTVELLKNGVGTGTYLVLSDENDWRVTFTGLALYENGELVDYSVEEVNAPDGYTSKLYPADPGDGEGNHHYVYAFVNEHNIDTTDIEVQKFWDDEDDQDGLRPESIDVTLTGTYEKDGVETECYTETKTLDASTDWTAEFYQLPINQREGNEVTYTVEEVEVPEGYESEQGEMTQLDDGSYLIKISNTHTPETIDIEGEKTWDDADNQDGKRPSSITIRLWGDGAIVETKTVTADANGDWTWSFADLPKYRDGGIEIVYNVTEDIVPDYSTTYDDEYGVINSYTPGKTSVTVTKAWDDADDQDGKRPDDITVELVKNGTETGDTITLDEANSWKGSFTDLDVYTDGEENVYTVKESGVPEDYTSVTTGDAETGFVITNTHDPETVNISGGKVWDDNNDQDGIRPDTIEVYLLADGERVTDEHGNDLVAVVHEDAFGGWTWAFTDLPKYADGKEIEYTVEEEPVKGYDTEITYSEEEGFVITNAHTPETVEVTVNKKWDDAGDQDGAEPGSVSVTLWADNTLVDEVEISAEDDWAHTFTDLPKYADGKEITYHVFERAVDDYSTAYETKVDEDGNYTFTVTNTHTPGKTSVTVTKAWDDEDNQDGLRPDSVEVNLIKTVGEETDTVATGTLSSDKNWTYTFDDLDVYEDGQEIIYSVEEVEIEGYDSEVTSADGNFVITNTHEPETVEVEGTKTWDDKDNQDGKRPESITITLWADSELVATETVTEADGWSWSFTDLPKYKNGVEITYHIHESAVDDYSATYGEDDYDITNSYTPEQTSLTVTKVWDDAEDQDGIRPESVEVQLMANGVPVTDGLFGAKKVIVTLDESNNWQDSFTELDKYADGKEIEYTVQEIPDEETAEAYETEIAGDAEVGFVITNTHEPETVDISGGKIWDDNDDQDGIRPDTIEVYLLADGERVTDEHGNDLVAVVQENSYGAWTWAFTDLPKYKNGVEIEYSVEEVEVAGYEATYPDGTYNIVNTHTPETVKVTVNKIWDDAGDQDGAEPGSVLVTLWADNTLVDEATISAEDKWTYTFTDLPKYADGKEITYHVFERAVDDYSTAYETEVDEDGNYTFTVTNTHTPGKTSVTVTKAWEDEDNQDGIRPGSVTVELVKTAGEDTDAETIATGTLSSDNNWTCTFDDLDVYEDGQEITYSVEEVGIEGYGSDITSEDGNFVITNTHTPETIRFSGEKKWDDVDNQDGKRPDSITVHLYADGKEIDSVIVIADANGNWNWSFTDLPKYEYGGVEITYAVIEDAVDDYTTTYGDYVTDDEGNISVSITNSYTPAKTSISVIKNWDDSNNQDGKRPSEITVSLVKNGTVTGDSITLDGSNNWQGSFVDLDAYTNGTENVYTVKENGVPEGYTSVTTGDAKTGYVITNTYGTVTVDVAGEKIWDDNNDQDGLRPAYIEVYLLADGERISDGHGGYICEEVKPDEHGIWRWNFTDLDQYDNGKEIEYSVEEVEVAGYETTFEGDNIINTHTPETISLSGEKIWDDANNQDGKRPESITIRVWNGDTMVGVVEVTEEDKWEWSFTGLPKYENGEEISYVVTEDAVDNYTSQVTKNGDGTYTVTNTYEPGKTSLTVVKYWDDGDNQDGKQTDSVTVNLIKTVNGESETVETVLLHKFNDWTYTFDDLDMYEGGQEITYTVTEDAVDGYDTVIYGNETTGYLIVNAHTPETVNVSVEKVWDDNNNQDGKVPSYITVRLLADGEQVDMEHLTAEDGWAKTFTDLPKYADGKEISYTVTEDVVTDYSTGYEITKDDETGDYTVTITNTHEPEKTSLTVTKAWDDADNQDGIRPDSVTVELLQNGETVKDGLFGGTVSVTLDKGNNWTASFTDLDVYTDGKENVYGVQEVDVDGYTAVVDGDAETGYVITNTHTPETVDISGVKDWDDNNDQDGIRPDSVEIVLLIDGEPASGGHGGEYVTTASAEDNWAWSFTGLDKYKGGEEIDYSVAEVDVDGYESEVVKNADDTYTITNTHEPEVTEVTATKVWDDADDQDGIRPGSITIRLLADGEPAQNTDGEAIIAIVTENDDWTCTFTDLPKYRDGGIEIAYTVTEDAIEDYSTDGYTYGTDDEGNMTVSVTNSYTPEQTSVTVAKAWDDQDDQDGIRPDDITVTLLANGEETGKTLVLDESNHWQGAFTELDVNTPVAQPIDYTVAEVSVDGYETDITGSAAEGYVVKNTHEPETIEIPVEKVWEEEDGTYNHRPDAVEVELLADGEDTDHVITLNDDNDWSATFTDIAKYRDHGTEIAYTVKEITPEALQYYTPKTTYNNDGSVTIINQREYFDIDEEIVPDEDDRDSWVKNEAVNEYNAIELEMSTYLPVIEVDELENGEFTMNFHEVLDSDLVLDEVDSDFSVYIGGKKISHDYYTITLASGVSPQSIKPLSSSPVDDGCTFHVDVDLTALYLDGIITEDDLQGDTEIMIFFYADLEGTDLNGTYKSTVWYEVWDGEDLEYTSSVDVVWVYTYEIYIKKYDEGTGETLAGATFGVYYDEECTNPVSRNGEPYTVVSGEDGAAIFYGLADGTYYVTEVKAPVGYVLSDEVLTVVLGEELNDNGYMYVGEYGNTPELTEVSGSKTWDDKDNQDGKRPESITVHLLADGEEVDSKTVTEADDWTWSFTDLLKYSNGTEINYTVTEDAVEDYTATYDGYDITNSYTPGKMSVTVVKTWDDSNDKDGIRPDNVIVLLLKNGEVTGQALVLDASNNWMGTFTDLDEYTNGEKNVYTVQEENVAGYTPEITGTADTAYVITNTHIPDNGNPDNGNPDNGNPDNGNPDNGNPSNGGNDGSGSGGSGSGSGSGSGGTGYNSSGSGSGSGSSSGSDTSSAGNAKTGDTNSLYLWIILMIAAAAAIVSVVTVRTRRQRARK